MFSVYHGGGATCLRYMDRVIYDCGCDTSWCLHMAVVIYGCDVSRLRCVVFSIHSFFIVAIYGSSIWPNKSYSLYTRIPNIETCG